MRWLLFGLFVGVFTGELKGEIDILCCRRRLEKLKFTDPQRALLYVDSLRAEGTWQREGYGFWLDIMQMGVYEVMGWDYLALMYGEKLLQQDSVRSSDPHFFRVVNSLVGECFRMEEYEKTLKYADLLLERGKQARDEWSVAAAYFATGQVKWCMNERGKAREWFSMALEVLEHRKNTGSIRLLSFLYGEMMNYAMQEEDYESALELGRRREELIRVMEGYGGHEEYIDCQKGFLFIKMACACQGKGKVALGRSYFRRFRATRFGASPEGRSYSAPYLQMSGDVGGFIGIEEDLQKEIVRGKGDSVNEAMIGCMKNLAWAYAKLGDYRKAYGYACRGTVLTDSLNERVKRNSFLELSVIYDVKNQEVRIQEQKVVLARKQWYIRLLAGGSGVLLLCMLGIGIHVCQIGQKNRKLMEQMKEKSVNRGRLPEGRKVGRPDKSEVLFRRLESLMQEERLFLSPVLSRDEVVMRLFTNKNHLSVAIRLYTKGSFTDYINRLRLEYALELLTDEQNYTIEAVAEKAGFGTVRSFYRIFKEKYSVSPATYKSFLKHN